MYIVCSKKEEVFNGQVANTVFQISSNPPTVAVSINKDNLTHEFITYSRELVISILAQDSPLSLIGKFGFKSGREVDKFSGEGFNLCENGIPYLTKHVIGYLAVKVTNEISVHTHTVFIGEVTDTQMFMDTDQMTYAYYQRAKKGTTPPSAPTYYQDTMKVNGPKYVCSVCSYIYDPADGIPPGTNFENLTNDWTCPVCGADKGQFELEGGTIKNQKEVDIMKTLENLLSAFAGESQANRKYLAFAIKAEKEGFSNIARILRAIAEAETVHALKHLEVAGKIGSTLENLGEAVEGEHHEYTVMYPEFIDIAKNEKQDKALKSFEYANEAEKVHGHTFMSLKQIVQDGKDMEDNEISMCPVCGWVGTGEPPERCPICNAAAKVFKKF